jgi:hypothetical protein
LLALAAAKRQFSARALDRIARVAEAINYRGLERIGSAA